MFAIRDFLAAAVLSHPVFCQKTLQELVLESSLPQVPASLPQVYQASEL